MKLPNAERAVIDIRKLTEYCLDPDSPRGRHKARVFASALGFTIAHAEDLHSEILNAVLDVDAELGELDFYGQRYNVDCKIKTVVGEAVVRTCWIIRRGEEMPRLTSCYILRKRSDEL